MKRFLLAACVLPIWATGSWAQTTTICTLVVSANSGKALVDDGDCERRFSPASTFKIPISLMGFDTGILISPDAPVWPFKKGYNDARPEWRKSQTPGSWMQHSTIWFSQQITTQLGKQKYANYVSAFGYGNRDLAGDPGKNNGLTNAWLSSSLKISAQEQVTFLRKLVKHELGVSEAATENTRKLMYLRVENGWHIFGKTGAGRVKNDGEKPKPFGWFVGWAERDGATVIFARLIQDSERQPVSPGLRTRDQLIAELFAKNSPLIPQ